MLRLISFLIFITVMTGLFFYVGGVSAFQLRNAPPAISLSAPDGLTDRAEMRDDRLFRFYSTDMQFGPETVICQVAYTEQISFRLIGKLMPDFLYTQQDAIMDALKQGILAHAPRATFTDIRRDRYDGISALYYSWVQPSEQANALEIRGQAIYFIHDGYGLDFRCYGARDNSTNTNRAFNRLMNSLRFVDSG